MTLLILFFYYLFKNPRDKVNLNLKEANKLFYQSSSFNMIIIIGGALVGALVLGGGFWILLKKRDGKFIFWQVCVGSLFHTVLRHFSIKHI